MKKKKLRDGKIHLWVDDKLRFKLKTVSAYHNTSMTKIVEALVNKAFEEYETSFNNDMELKYDKFPQGRRKKIQGNSQKEIGQGKEITQDGGVNREQKIE